MLFSADLLPTGPLTPAALTLAENALRADSKRQTVVRALALTPRGAKTLARHRAKWLAAGCDRAPFDFVLAGL